MSTSTTGTGTVTLGTATTGYQSFADAGVFDADTVSYLIKDGLSWEVGTGTYSSTGPALTRSPIESTNDDAALDLSGFAVVSLTALASDIVQPANNLSDLTDVAAARTNLNLGTMAVETAADYAELANNLSDLPDAAAARTNLGVGIGVEIFAYDANLQGFIDTFTLPTTDGSNGQALITNGSGTLSLEDLLTASSTDTLTNKTISGADNTLTVDGTNPVGFLNIPPVGVKTGSYTLTLADVGKYVQVGSGGSITVPDAVFSEGDAVVVFNNTTGDITITCSITTAYISGTDTDVASVTLATRGVANILFISGTVCVITGNVA